MTGNETRNPLVISQDEKRANYLERMATCRAFTRTGIEPEWRPGAGDVPGFCHDEVVRQGHDTRLYFDGGQRIKWMLNAWDYAQANATKTPDVYDVLRLGSFVEPDVNNYISFRTKHVYIGGRMGMPPRYLHRLVEILCWRLDIARKPDGRPLETGRACGLAVPQYQPDMFVEQVDEIETVDDWYIAFQAIHPFLDGNGRTGKVLHNWVLKTLDEPVLVRDYFGGGNP